MRLQRHDQAWLARDFEPQLCLCDVRLADAARTWIRAGRPLVVASQHGLDAHQVRLGFTLPAVDVRQRVGLIVARSALARVEPALALVEAIDRSPPGWRDVMRAVEQLCARCRVTPRVFGSLAAELASGENYLQPSSDLDLLFECGSNSSARRSSGWPARTSGAALRASMAKCCSPAAGRLPGANSIARSRSARRSKVLARSDRELRLLRLAQLFPFAQAA